METRRRISFCQLLDTEEDVMVTVRKAKSTDAKIAWEIRNSAIMNQCINYYPIEDLEIWTRGDLTKQFTDAVEKHFYVAIRNTQVVGTGTVDMKMHKIDAIFVHPSHIKKGIGKKIVNYLENLAQASGLNELCLESTLNAAPFYRACGFVGDQVSKYASPTGVFLDCIPMIKTLTPNQYLNTLADKHTVPEH